MVLAPYCRQVAFNSVKGPGILRWICDFFILVFFCFFWVHKRLHRIVRKNGYLQQYKDKQCQKFSFFLSFIFSLTPAHFWVLTLGWKQDKLIKAPPEHQYKFKAHYTWHEMSTEMKLPCSLCTLSTANPLSHGTQVLTLVAVPLVIQHSQKPGYL